MTRILLICFAVIGNMVLAQQLKPLQFKDEIYDFGYVDEVGGRVMHQFDFVNVSSRPIKILSVKASCGCTTPDWSQEVVGPGKAGYIQAVFDPKGRPGYFSKTLTVVTDFDSNPILLQIKGQVSSALSVSNDLKVSKGNWRLRGTLFNVGRVFIKDEWVTKDFPVHNDADHDLKVIKIDGPPHIRVEAIPLNLKPNEIGKLRVGYNGMIKNQYGFQSDNVDIHTNDEEMPTKSFTVYATLEEYFGEINAEKLSNGPKINFEKTSFDMGSITTGKMAKQSLVITNIGKKELIIRYIQPNCTCVKGNVTTSSIRPGASTTLEVTFDSSNREGMQNKSVSVYSNDPSNPIQRITFTANVGI